ASLSALSTTTLCFRLLCTDVNAGLIGIVITFLLVTRIARYANSIVFAIITVGICAGRIGANFDVFISNFTKCAVGFRVVIARSTSAFLRYRSHGDYNIIVDCEWISYFFVCLCLKLGSHQPPVSVYPYSHRFFVALLLVLSSRTWLGLFQHLL